ncbi:MAG TPA: 2-oxo acid dehydrogenase subunit E2, partial [Acidimicrobiales bacterium]|nr:2-oxo acid dehydrogenase subunit E2 [Acidimicrobiales bacterium]
MSEQPEGAVTFGPNAWLVDDMYEQYRQDPSSVSESWREFFENYRPGGVNLARPGSRDLKPAEEEATPPVPAPTPSAPSAVNQAVPLTPRAATIGDGSDRGPGATPTAESPAPAGAGRDAAVGERATPLRGAAARVVANMTASLGVPTATSFRVVPARLLEVNRKILNNQLSRTGSAGKVSFTHLIGYAVVEAMRAVPVMNSSFVPAAEGDPKAVPAVVRHEHIGLGIAVDLEKSDGSRTLLVPVIKDADQMDFRSFWSSYEELIRKVRSGKVGADDLAGATVSLTNPGTLGTVQSVPRLMPGQGAIIGVGTIDYPAEWQAADPRVLAELGVSKVVTITSTYDHRIIQGAESGAYLQKVHQLLTGADDFYQRVFKDMGVPYEPVRFHRDVNDLAEGNSIHLRKQIEVDNLINMYRVRGHL